MSLVLPGVRTQPFALGDRLFTHSLKLGSFALSTSALLFLSCLALQLVQTLQPSLVLGGGGGACTPKLLSAALRAGSFANFGCFQAQPLLVPAHAVLEFCRFRKLWHRPFRKLWHSLGEAAPPSVTIS